MSAMALNLPLLTSACGELEEQPGHRDDDALARIRKAGKVRAGFAGEVPYGFTDAAGRFTGQSPTVIRAVFAELGVDTVEGVEVLPDDLLSGLRDGDFDVAAMYINGEDCALAAFSNPDHCATTAFAVPRSNPLDIATFDDIVANPEIRLGVLLGSVEELYAHDAGIPEQQVSTYHRKTELFQALVDGHVDAISMATIALNWTVRQDFSHASIAVTRGIVPVSHGREIRPYSGYAFRAVDGDLVREFNKILFELQNNGRLVELLEPFGFTGREINLAASRTVSDLCSSRE
jgi:polar amino acid transport system substrate-binding protein